MDTTSLVWEINARLHADRSRAQHLTFVALILMRQSRNWGEPVNGYANSLAGVTSDGGKMPGWSLGHTVESAAGSRFMQVLQ